MYFSSIQDTKYFINEWNALYDYIKHSWKSDQAANLGGLSHHLEVKALYVFTISRHLLTEVEKLPQNGNWKPIFIEASILLFPMLELVGEARMGGGIHDGSWRRLASGVDWLIDPNITTTRSNGTRTSFSNDEFNINSLGNYMTTQSNGPKVRELYHLRNYLIHGLRNQDDRNYDLEAIKISLNYELPYAIVQQAKKCLFTYWNQLKNDKNIGPINWIDRLSEAKIYPLGILGSVLYDKGIIDPDIIYWIEKLQ
jgi:hypothetical protein